MMQFSFPSACGYESAESCFIHHEALLDYSMAKDKGGHAAGEILDTFLYKAVQLH